MNNLPPEYAPTSTTSFTVSTDASVYNQEITRASLVKTPLHKSLFDSLAEIYSILPTLEMIEVSFLKDYITDKEKYISTTYRLIHQYQMVLKMFSEDEAKLNLLITEVLPGLHGDMSNFLDLLQSKFNINFPHAVIRLKNGLPATIEQINGLQPNNVNSRLVAEITGNFITCMDAVKLNYKSKDQLHPLLSELVLSLNELNESLEFNGKSKLINWLIKINNLTGELTQEESDSFLNDLDIAYKGFYTTLE
ncbi:Vacuolar protein sorting-associated protein 28 [Candida viswanathii]|uniref:Vacuolar protein sorting-associated protein 28 n=1 Tax=Candida viswanathii TaxID=5486 RepID=A0A367XPJ5_9ASCO|nr:Vacuolar protein sorting-associated protein 28 [Candida viswanathii]